MKVSSDILAAACWAYTEATDEGVIADGLMAAIEAAVEAEREACAKIADECARDECSPSYIASAIRERGKSGDGE